jgi:ubiquinol-cytochrome c reductase cytochrome b subunit
MIDWLRRLWHLIDDRTGLKENLGYLLEHKVPPNLGWPYVLGSATLIAFGMQVATGIALATAYIPSTAEAYNSLLFITHEAPLGNLMRGMHFYGAAAMVILVALHAIRTYLYGAYKFPREVNWLTGVVLLGLTLLMAWTGQLLRWDENGVWTVVVGAHVASRFPLIGHEIAYFMLGGQTVGGATLSRFFVFHILFLPLLIMAVVGFHLYLVIHHGISEPPRAGKPVDPATYRSWYERMLAERGVPFWPNAAWRDAVFGVMVVGVVLALAFWFGAVELGGPPDPTRLHANPVPDWYFRWYDALVTLALPELEYAAMCLIPLALTLLAFALPLLANRGERALSRRPWAILAVFFLLVTWGWLTLASRRPHLAPIVDVEPLPAEVVGATTGPIAEGARIYYEKACINCHAIEEYGGLYGPELTHIADRLSPLQIQIRILNGSPNMPPYVDTLTLEELDSLMAFMLSRRVPAPEE